MANQACAAETFKAKDYPGTPRHPLVDVVLTHPPFVSGHKVSEKKRLPQFIDRGMEALQDGGILVAIVPDILLNSKVRAAPLVDDTRSNHSAVL